MNKVVLAGTVFLLSAVAGAASADQRPICLSTKAIASTSPAPDGRAIVFRMTDGSVWRNDLRGRCPDMRWDGFTWTTSNPLARVCEDEQTLRLIKTGEVCGLGKFTQLSPPSGHSFATGER